MGGLKVPGVVSVKSNIKGFMRQLNRFQRRQIPFATSLALNDTIFQVRKRIVERTWRRSFKVRNRRFPGALFRVKKATKRNLTATLYDRLGRASLDLHIDGGTKRPKGRHLAIPTGNVKRTATGKIGKAKRPSALLKKPRTFKLNWNDNTGMPAGIYQRVGKKRLPIKMLFRLKPSARIKKSFPFYEDAQDTTRRAFDHNFARGLRRALRTAR